ncbi:radical SAM family heme chaperone HemW [Corynebacterium choanae]|nr:radical SAM family heme chaperone HemW [Corynebacterium choanae]
MAKSPTPVTLQGHDDHLGVYIHVPFCASRCGYCDFNTYTAKELAGGFSIAGYLAALSQELENAAEILAASTTPHGADTVFFGGGTPSLLGADTLAQVLAEVSRTIGLAPNCEITTEANPESTSPDFFATLHDSGFTRVSLGMQSTSSRVLSLLGRKHSPGRALQAAEEAIAAGFTHVNLDMIYGTPTETEAEVAATLQAIIETGVDHVSAYSLIVEAGTAFARRVSRGELIQTDDDVLAQRYELIAATLQAHGFDWYEVSNWAKPGGQCRHNLIYWRNRNWWGAGPGAHGHIDGVRRVNVKHPARYHSLSTKDQLPLAEVEHLTAAEHHTETVMVGLRLVEGIDATIIDPRAYPTINDFVQRGLLHQWDDPTTGQRRIAVTDRGRLLADGIIAEILISEESA